MTFTYSDSDRVELLLDDHLFVCTQAEYDVASDKAIDLCYDAMGTLRAEAHENVLTACIIAFIIVARDRNEG